MHNITLVLKPSYEQSNIVSAGSFILLLLAEQVDWTITDAAYTMTLGNGQTVDVLVQCGTCILLPHLRLVMALRILVLR